MLQALPLVPSDLQVMKRMMQPVLAPAMEQVRDPAMFQVAMDGCLVSWNEGVGLILGWSRAEWIGQPLEVAYTPEDVHAGVPQGDMRQAAVQGRADDHRWMQRRGGERVYALGSMIRLLDDAGAHVGYLMVLRLHDRGESRRREADSRAMLLAAQQARDAAERASRTKDEFLATISHELRTPLSAIVGWSQVLERGVYEAQTVQRGLAAISRNARMQLRLIEDLLDMNHIENGEVRLDLERIELGALIAAAIDAALPAAIAKGVGLCAEVGAVNGAVNGSVTDAVKNDVAATVTGDPARLQQVVANLLNNAIKFTPEGGHVHVTLTQDQGVAHIAVADTGQGIEPDFLQRLFDRFQQCDARPTRRHGGLGIGLFIARRLVQLHGGRVDGHSAGPGRGATFTVTLPVQGSRPAEPGPIEALRLDGVSVLLVEDEADVRAVTVQVLQDAGAHVLAAASADEGLTLLRRHRPAVLLSDIGMPVKDGYELLRRVRELPAHEGGQTPAAAFTAYAQPEDQQRVLRAGFQMHLVKPVLPTALLSSVAALLRAAPAQASAT